MATFWPDQFILVVEIAFFGLAAVFGAFRLRLLLVWRSMRTIQGIFHIWILLCWLLHITSSLVSLLVPPSDTAEIVGAALRHFSAEMAYLSVLTTALRWFEVTQGITRSVRRSVLLAVAIVLAWVIVCRDVLDLSEVNVLVFSVFWTCVACAPPAPSPSVRSSV